MSAKTHRPKTHRHPAARFAPLPQKKLSRLLAGLLGMTPLVMADVLLTQAWAQNLPQGGSVISGAATISSSGNAMTVNQSSGSAILNWQSFSIGAGNSVRFNQPSASSVALNRVIGNGASEIFGSLSANGQVFLINQNGILMGQGAQISAGGGFLASTLNIKDSDFLAGRYLFDRANNPGGAAGSIVNHGSITSPSGYAALIAPQVTQNGYIAANLGKVAIGAGDRVAVDLVGDGLMSLKVEQAALNAAIVNSGQIEADGGTVLLAASSANALLDTVINSTGVIRANSIANVNGRIVLDGGATGITSVSGSIVAAGTQPGETGGSIKVLGDKVGLMDNARLDASGDAGGGSVLVGGAFQGKGPEHNAGMAHVAPGASIDVSARSQGNGGQAVVWSDQVTRFYGTVNATGGGQGGDGGNVEVSGKQYLDYAGKVDTTAARGATGTLLLDPTNMEISNSSESGFAGNPNTTVQGTWAVPTAAGSRLTWETIATTMATTSLQITNGDPNANPQPFDAGEGGVISLFGFATLPAGALIIKAANTVNYGADVTIGAANANGFGYMQLDAPISVNILQNSKITIPNGYVRMHANNVTINGTVQAAGTTDPSTSGIVVNSGTGSIEIGGAILAGNNHVTLQGKGVKTTTSSSRLEAGSLGVISTGNVDLATWGKVNVSGTDPQVSIIAPGFDVKFRNVSIDQTANTLARDAQFKVGSVTDPLDNFSASSLAVLDPVTNLYSITGISGNNIALAAVNNNGSILINAPVTASTTGVVTLQGNSGVVADATKGVITAGTIGVSTVNGPVILNAPNVLAAGGIFSGRAGGDNLSFRSVNGFSLKRANSTDLTTFIGTNNGINNGLIGANTGASLFGGVTFSRDLDEIAGTTDYAVVGGNVTLKAGGDMGIFGPIRSGVLRLDASGDISLGQGSGGLTKIFADTLGARGTSVNLSSEPIVAGTVAIAASTGGVSFAKGVFTATGTPLDQTVGDTTLTIGSVAADAAGLFTATSGITAANGQTIVVRTDRNLSIAAPVTASGGKVLLQAVGKDKLNGANNPTTKQFAAITQTSNGTIATGDLGVIGSRIDLAQANNATAGKVAMKSLDGTLAFSGGGFGAVDTLSSLGSLFEGASGLTTLNKDLTFATSSGQTNAPINAGTANLYLAGVGTQNANGVITGNNLYVLNGGDLSVAANQISGTLAGSSSGSFKFRNSGAINVGSIAGNTVLTSNLNGVSSGTGSTDIALFSGSAAPITLNQGISTTGKVTLNSPAGITQGASGAIVAGSLELLGTGNAVLTNASNNIGTLAGTLAGSLTYVDTNAMSIGSVNNSTGLNTGNNDVTLKSGALAINQPLSVGTGTLRIQSSDAVTQASAGVVTAANLGVAGTSVDVGGAANVVSGNVALNASAGDAKFRSNGAITLGSVASNGDLFADVTGITASGNVTLNAAGNVTQQAGANITGAGLELLGSGAVTLNNAANNVATLAGSTTAAVSYTDADALAIGSVNSTGLASGTGNITLASGALAVNQPLSGASIRLQSSGAVTQAAAGVVTATGLGVRGTSIDLSAAANALTGSVALNASAGDAKLRSAGAIALGNVAADGTLFAATSGITASGNVSLNSAGGITQAAGANITASGLEFLGSGAVTLNNAGNNVATIAGNVSNSLSYTDADALAIGTVNTTGLNTGKSDLNLSAGTLAINQATSGNNVGLTGTNGITLAANLDAVGTLSLNTTNSAVTQSAGRVVDTAGLVVFATGTGAVTLDNAANDLFNLSGTSGALSYTDVNAIKVGPLTVNGNLTINAADNVTQGASLTQTGSGTLVSITSTNGGINLTRLDNEVQGAVSFSALNNGAAFINNSAAGIKVGNIAVSTKQNNTNPIDAANFTLTPATLQGVALLRALRGDVIGGGTKSKIVADRAVVIAANRIGGVSTSDPAEGLRVEGKDGATMRQVFLNSASSQAASIFGASTLPEFLYVDKYSTSILTKPLDIYYNGASTTAKPAGATAAVGAAQAGGGSSTPPPTSAPGGSPAPQTSNLAGSFDMSPPPADTSSAPSSSGPTSTSPSGSSSGSSSSTNEQETR